MLTKIRKVFAPPVFAGNEEKTETAALLNTFLLIVLVGSIVYPVGNILYGSPIISIVNTLAAILIVISIGLLALLRFGYVTPVATLLGLSAWLLFTIGIFAFNGLHDTAITGYFFVIILFSLIARARVLLISSGLIIVSVFVIYMAEQMGIITPAPKIPSGADDLILLTTIIAISVLLLSVTVSRRSRTLATARENARRTDEANETLSATIAELAKNRAQLNQQALRIERQSNQLKTAVEIGNAITSILDPDELTEQVVKLIRSSFNLYYVGLFLVDENAEWAVLKNGTGIAGKRMLARNHRIRIGEGLIGWAIANAQARVASQVEADAIRLTTDELPETRSEAAIPLRAREKVIGAFTIQNTQPDAFDEDIIAIFQSMADQVAVALDNARLYNESQDALEISRRAFGEISKEAWQSYLKSGADLNFIATPINEFKPQEAEWTPEMSDTFQVGQITRHGNRTIHIPIILRDQTLGVVRLQKREETDAWSDDEIELMDTLVDQLETALESARLYTDTQRQAQRERLTHEVTDKLHRSLDMDSLMQTLLQEISNALGVSEAFVQLSATSPEPGSASQPGQAQ